MPRSNETASLAIVGVGAIGGSVAADLDDLGRHHDLTLCTRAPFDALRVDHPRGRSTAAARVVTQPGDTTPVDWVLLCTKAHQSAGAGEWLRALCGPSTRVAVLQNGVDHRERIEPLVPVGCEIVPVVVQLPAEKLSPGHILQDSDGTLVVANDPAGLRFAELFAGARTRVATSDDFVTQAWWKLLSNAALGGVCALALRENAAATEPGVRELVLALMNEVRAVALAEGAKLPVDAPDRTLDLMVGRAPDHWSSITVDRREGRPMEWVVRNAVVGRLARRHGIETPLNDAITTLLAAADAPTA